MKIKFFEKAGILKNFSTGKTVSELPSGVVVEKLKNKSGVILAGISKTKRNEIVAAFTEKFVDAEVIHALYGGTRCVILSSSKENADQVFYTIGWRKDHNEIGSIVYLQDLDFNVTKEKIISSLYVNTNTEVCSRVAFFNRPSSGSARAGYQEVAVSQSRVFQHAIGNSVGVITAWRKGFESEINNKRNAALIEKIKAAGFGFTHVKGAFPEKQENGEYQQVSERSLMIIASPSQSNLLRKKLKEWGAEYEQDFVAFKSPDTDDMVGIGTANGFEGRVENYGKFSTSAITNYYSTLKQAGKNRSEDKNVSFRELSPEEEKRYFSAKESQQRINKTLPPKVAKPNKIATTTIKNKEILKQKTDWWGAMSWTAQKLYLKAHPESKLEITAKQTKKEKREQEVEKNVRN